MLINAWRAHGGVRPIAHRGRGRGRAGRLIMGEDERHCQPWPGQPAPACGRVAGSGGAHRAAEAAILAGTRATRPAAGSPPSAASARSPQRYRGQRGRCHPVPPARHFAAWIGLVPKQHSSGGKQRQGGIPSRAPLLRRLLVVGATAVIRHMGGRLAATPSGAWAKALLDAARRGWPRWRWPTRLRASRGLARERRDLLRRRPGSGCGLSRGHTGRQPPGRHEGSRE